MKCSSRISKHCKKNFKKSEVCYINGQEVCRNCFWLLKLRKKQKKGNGGNPTGRRGKNENKQ